MNSAFDDNHAGSQPGRFVRRAAHTALACALVLGSGLAMAQQRGDRDFSGPSQQQGERFRLPQQEREARPADMRFDEQRDQRHAQQYQQPEQQDPQRSRSGRMTADERREMRRQVNEAKDFYPQRH